MNKYFVFMLLTVCTLISCNDDEDVVDDFPKINHVFSFEDKKVFVRPGMEVEIEALEPFMMSSMNRFEGDPNVGLFEESIIFLASDSAKSTKMAVSFKEQQASMSGVNLKHVTAKGLHIRVDEDIMDTVKIRVKARVTKKSKEGFDDKVDIYVIPPTE